MNKRLLIYQNTKVNYSQRKNLIEMTRQAAIHRAHNQQFLPDISNTGAVINNRPQGIAHLGRG